MYFYNFIIISQCKDVAFPFKQLKSPSPKVTSCQVEIGPVVLEKMIFLNLLMYFRNLVIIFHGNRMGPSLEQTQIPFSKRYFVPSFGEIGPVVLEKTFFKFFNICLQLTPIGKKKSLSFEQTWIPFTRRYFVPSFVEIGPGFWRRWFFKFVNVFSHFLIFSSWNS